jgi:hypothetical protein
MAIATTAVSVSKNSDNRYQLTVQGLTDPLVIKNQGGGDWWYQERQDTYTSGSYKSEISGAIRIVENDVVSYKLLIKNTSTWKESSGRENTTINWEVVKINDAGQVSTSTWTRAVSEFEGPLDQDFNGDGQKGVVKTQVATSGTAILLKDADGSAYVKEGSSEKLVMNSWGDGNAASLLANETWGNGGMDRSIAGFKKTDAGDYLLAIKQSNYSLNSSGTKVFNQTSWSIVTVASDGKISRQDWSNGIASYESSSYFNADLNGDGFIGLDGGRAIKIIGPSTNETAFSVVSNGVYAGRDADGSIYVVRKDASSVTYKAIGWSDPSLGVRPDMIENSWAYGDSKGESKVIAIKEVTSQSQSDSYFLLAIKQTNTTGSETTVNWSIRKLKESTNLIETDWSGSVWTKSIGTWEVEFNKDLNGDNTIGVGALTPAITDTEGAARLNRDADKALYIVDSTGGTVQKLLIKDQWGNSPQLESSWSGGAAMPGYGSGSTTAIAVERVNPAGSGDHTYKLAIKSSYTYDGKTEVNWTIHTVSKDGLLDWSKSTYTKSISKFESTFQQDLNGDGAIGTNLTKLTAIATDTTGAQLVKDAEGALYIKNGSTVESITDSWGSTPSFEHSSSWSQGSYESKPIAVERQSDGTYLMAIRQVSKWKDSAGIEKTDVNWQVHTLSSTGVMDWMNSKYTKSITTYEKAFNQDLNGDGYTGIDPASLKDVTTDTTGVGLAKDNDGGIYLKSGTTITAITDTRGNTPTLEYAHTWTSWDGKTTNSNKSEVIAAERQDDGTYKLAVKNTNSYDGKTDTSWQIYTLTSEGKLDWGSPAGMASSWSRNITKFEPLFKQDLNGDGAIGIDLASLTAVSTDTTGATLLRGGKQEDNTSEIYIKDGSTILSLSDPYGGTPNLEYRNTWAQGSSQSEAVAVEKQSDGTYKLAIKYSNTYNETTDTNWQVHTLSAKGVIDWSKSSWSRSITGSETLFNQDLNGDGYIGIDPSTLTFVSTDTVGAMLAKSPEGNLYIKDGSALTAVSDIYGGTPSLEYSNSWGEGSYKSEAVAVEKQADGTFKLAVRQTNTWSGNTSVNWQVYTLSSDGKLDWSKSSYAKGIASFEPLFNQDLSGDGIIGIDPASLLPLATDKTGAMLSKDTDGSLYIVDGSSVVTITDIYGGMPQLTYSSSWSGGSSSADALAVQRQSDGTYRLVIRNSYTNGDSKDVSYQVHSLSDKGVLDWSKSSWSKSIAGTEPLFAQDLNDDGRIGIDPESIKIISTDSKDERLARDSERALYVVDANSSIVAITESSGAIPTFEWSNTWEGGSYKSEGYAVQKQAGGGYRLAVKSTSTYNGETNINWQIYTLNDSAQIDRSKMAWTRSVAAYETAFAQDLNEDGQIGIDTSKLTAISTDKVGATLMRDAEGALYIKETESLLAISDTYGGTPYLEWSSSWTGGSSRSEAIAVEKQSDGSYRLAIKSTNVYNGRTDVSWQIHTLNSQGQLDWTKSSWTRSVTAVETLFNQDLDDDGSKGVDATKLTQITTDTKGVGLYRDSNFSLYIKDGNNYISVLDSNGGAPALEYTDSWTGGKTERQAFAVEKLSNGSFVLVIKIVSTVGSAVSTSWEVMSLGAASQGKAVIDWSSLAKVSKVSATEDLVQEDLNNDGVVGSGEKLDITTDTSGVGLARDTGGTLYIKRGATYITLVNAQGQAVSLEPAKAQGDWGSVTTEAIAAESVMKTENGTSVLDYYLVAVRVTKVTGAGSSADTEVTWKIYTVSPEGKVDPVPLETPSITAYEAIFNESALDSNTARTGLDSATLDAIDTDSGTHTLATDPDGALYIQTSGSANPLLISSSQPIELAGGEGEPTTQAIAVAGIEVGGSISHYLLATKTTLPLSLDSVLETWDILRIDTDGQLNWDESSLGVNISEYERSFAQDLNGDGAIGETALNTLQLDQMQTGNSVMSV